MSAINAKASRKTKKYAVLTREPRCFLGSLAFSWEQRKLGELVDVCSGRDYKHLSEGTIPVYGTGGYMLSVNDALSYDQDAIGIGRKGTIDRPYILKAPFWTVDTLFYAIPREKVDLNFAFDIFQTIDWKKKDESTGVPSLSKTAINDIDVLAPKHGEQQTIGQFFAAIDHLITLHQRKCVFLFSFFRACISMNFTASTFSWEQRKLGDIGKARSGVGFPDADQGGVTGVPFFKVSDMNLDGNENEMIVANNYVTAEQIADHRWSPITELPAIFFAKVGAAVMLNRKRLCRFPFLLDNNTMAYSLSPTKWDADFAKALFGTVDLTSLVQVGALPSYNAGDVESMGIYLPSLFEQEQIGAFFKLLDNLITLHQRECISFTGSAGRLILTANKKRTASSWEQRKLGDMMNVTSVKRIHQSDWTDSGVRFLRARDIVAAAKNEEPDDYLYISKEKYEEYSALSGKVGVSDLLVTGVGTIGVPYLVRNLEPLYFKDGNIIWFQNSDKIDGKFLFYSFSAEQIQGFINESAGIGTVGTYTIESGKKTPISLPNQIEQAKVGDFFQQLDNLITLHQRKPFLMKWRTSDANRNQTNRLVL